MTKHADLVVERIEAILAPSAAGGVRRAVEAAVHTLDATSLSEVVRVLDEVVDLEERTVENVLGRDGELKPIHHYRACRAEDAETSWNHRAPSPPVRHIRDALLSSVLGPDGLAIDGGEEVVSARREGVRMIFVANHESVFDLAVLARALDQLGLRQASERVTFFVNPKIFNLAFVNFFVCKPLGLIKMPQSPRIAANESVMAPDEVRRRAEHGFEVAKARMVAGDDLAIYPEGLRSEGELHRFAKAYLELLAPSTLADLGLSSREAALVPWAHRGVRELEALQPDTPVEVRFGTPVSAAEFFERIGSDDLRVAAHVVGYLVARLLPEPQRGLYGFGPERYLEETHPRKRVKEHTLRDMTRAREIVDERW